MKQYINIFLTVCSILSLLLSVIETFAGRIDESILFLIWSIYLR